MDYHPTGIKAQTEEEPSDKELLRLEQQLSIIRNRYERWLRVKYRVLLKRIRAELIKKGVPTEEDITALEMYYEDQQTSILTRFYETIYPEFGSFIMDDETAKSYAPPKLEIKRQLSLGILAWIKETVGVHIRIINGYVPPLDDVRQMAWTSEGDPVKFKEAMDKSQMWSTTGMEVRSRRIAVTETTIGMNNSMAKTSERLAMGRKRIKTWHTSGLRNVRDSHRRMNGKTINADDFYEVPVYEWVKGTGLVDTGAVDLMRYPGDHSIPPHASNVVNCHCFVTYRYKKED